MIRTATARCSAQKYLYALVLAAFAYAVPLSGGQSPEHQGEVHGGGFVPDTIGAIEEITIHYNHGMEQELTPLYLDLFSALRPNVHIRVLCQSTEEMHYFFDTWSGLIASIGDSLAVVNVEVPLTIWARDRLISRQSLDLRDVLPSFVPTAHDAYEEPKLNELDAQLMLAESDLSPPLLDAALFIEGGNVVSSSHHTFVGANIIVDNAERPPADMAFEAIAGRELIVVPTSGGGVPWCHVDMYLAPITDSWIMVADTRLGNDLMRRDEHWASQEEDANGASTLIHDQLDDVASSLERRGFIVLRMPALVDPIEEWMVTYTNVLMEIVDGQRRALVPNFGIARLDDFAAATYRSLGFEVSTVDVSGVYELGGALRCVANVTRRRPS